MRYYGECVKTHIRLNKLKYDLEFLRTCKRENLLPNFTRIKLANSALYTSKLIYQCRLNILQAELKYKKRIFTQTYKHANRLKNEIKISVPHLTFVRLQRIMDEIVLKKSIEVQVNQEKKLHNLRYFIYMKQIVSFRFPYNNMNYMTTTKFSNNHNQIPEAIENKMEKKQSSKETTDNYHDDQLLTTIITNNNEIIMPPSTINNSNNHTSGIIRTTITNNNDNQISSMTLHDNYKKTFMPLMNHLLPTTSKFNNQQYTTVNINDHQDSTTNIDNYQRTTAPYIDQQFSITNNCYQRQPTSTFNLDYHEFSSKKKYL